MLTTVAIGADPPTDNPVPPAVAESPGEADNLGAVAHGTGVPHIGEADNLGAVAHGTGVPHLGWLNRAVMTNSLVVSSLFSLGSVEIESNVAL